ncbi:multicopper oxidase domain-containing protein [Archangium sp.]|uniref:multicopper oxidase domain-containing protein n=1 Tax=Archangium sp. TaxID=1872627 RepID=UPI002D71893C|nr:multicopper oxidase domain-containing protein [Archangium sp.]HYO51211.1 multicopper oxidase domain-containing protein [Archangium sp.]
MSTALPDPEELAPLAPFKAIEDAELTSAGMQMSIFEVRLGSDPTHPFNFLVNGKEFSPHDPPRKLTLGAVEEWFVASVGDANFKGHPFHIHVNPFQYKDKDGRIIWKDTVFVPRGESLLGPAYGPPLKGYR